MDARPCPHCGRWAVKDAACNYVVCGRARLGVLARAPDGEALGCGRPWCFACGGKLCGRMFDTATGRLEDPNEDHNHPPGTPCDGPGYCPGGHNSHKEARRPVPRPAHFPRPHPENHT